MGCLLGQEVSLLILRKACLESLLVTTHSLGVLYLYCKQIKVEVDDEVRWLASMVICSSLLYCAEALSSSLQWEYWPWYDEKLQCWPLVWFMKMYSCEKILAQKGMVNAYWITIMKTTCRCFNFLLNHMESRLSLCSFCFCNYRRVIFHYCRTT